MSCASRAVIGEIVIGCTLARYVDGHYQSFRHCLVTVQLAASMLEMQKLQQLAEEVKGQSVEDRWRRLDRQMDKVSGLL